MLCLKKFSSHVVLVWKLLEPVHQDKSERKEDAGIGCGREEKLLKRQFQARVWKKPTQLCWGEQAAEDEAWETQGWPVTW